MRDPRVVEPWMRWELDRLNTGLVIRTRSLRALLEGSSLVTREGEPYPLDRGVLERIAAACPPADRGRLRLPVTLHFSADVEDSAYVIDAFAADVLRRLEGWGDAYPYRDGKMWLPTSLAVDLILRYGGVLQRLML